MGKFDGKVVLITGGARGQGRSHALAFAREGADIAICDVASQLGSVPYPMSEPADLDETARMVEELDRRCVVARADVRDRAEVDRFVAGSSRRRPWPESSVSPTSATTARPSGE